MDLVVQLLLREFQLFFGAQVLRLGLFDRAMVLPRRIQVIVDADAYEPSVDIGVDGDQVIGVGTEEIIFDDRRDLGDRGSAGEFDLLRGDVRCGLCLLDREVMIRRRGLPCRFGDRILQPRELLRDGTGVGQDHLVLRLAEGRLHAPRLRALWRASAPALVR